MVAADTAAGRAAVKNSCTRNLHRLMSAIMFIKILFERIMSAPEVRPGALRPLAGAAAARAARQRLRGRPALGRAWPLSTSAPHAVPEPRLRPPPPPPRQAHLRDAASEAYEASLAPFHTGLIRGVVRAGLLTLPSRDTFLAAVGETEASIAPRAEEVVASCSAVVRVVSKLLAGIDFPVSDGGWMGGLTAPPVLFSALWALFCRLPPPSRLPRPPSSARPLAVWFWPSR
jgi:hypothetical protein